MADAGGAGVSLGGPGGLVIWRRGREGGWAAKLDVRFFLFFFLLPWRLRRRKHDIRRIRGAASL